MSPNDELIY